MAAYHESKALSEAFQKVRDLTKWYFSLLKGVDPYHQWEVNGVKLNSVIWLASHLVWAEDFLILRGTGGKGLDIDWLEHYRIKSAGHVHHPEHNMKTILDSLKMVHEAAMNHLATISDEQMDMDNAHGLGFGGPKTNRIMIQHAIRHEAMHTGHLSWLCKINKVETV